MDSYRDKVVVITGSATGIGLALAGQFGADGAKLVVSGLPADDIDGAVEQLHSRSFTVVGKACDVTDRAQVEALAEFAWGEFGHVDVIVNNAGISHPPTPLLQVDPEQFRAIYEVNIFGMLNGIQAFGARFVEQGTPAAIYNIGSENSVYPCVPSAHAYVSSKHAVLAITELLAEEMPDHVEVAFIMPGLVKSEMTRSLGMGMATDDFAATVMRQLKAGEFYIVSHAYNRVRLDQRHAAIGAAFDKYAPRYEGDDEYDIRELIAKLNGENR